MVGFLTDRRRALGGILGSSALFVASSLLPLPVLGFGHEKASRRLVGPPEKLDQKAIGHIRHFRKLANQLPGDWSEMGEGAPGWDAIPERSTRYQLAFMAYALASVQVNRTPAFKEIYRDTISSLFDRLIEPDNWREWINVSRGGPMQHPDQTSLAEGWIDPIRRHNVMFGGHVLHIASLYDTLYQESRYTEAGSISLKFNESNWGFGPKTFEYSIPDIAKIFFDQFAELNFSGFPCEPTLTFPQCPQHAVLGIMLADRLCGTNYSSELQARYLHSWKTLGYLNEDGTISGVLRLPELERLPQEPSAEMDAWTGIMMHGWAPEFVRSLYHRQRKVHLPRLFDRRISGVPERVVEASTSFGFFAGYAKEVGDQPTQRAMLDFADENFSPVWRDGRYYYPRNDDASLRDNGVFVMNSCLQGNALLPFARLNVPSGMTRLHSVDYASLHEDDPHISDVDYDATGVASAWYSPGDQTLSVDLLPGPVAAGESSFSVVKIPACERIRVVRKLGGESVSLGKGELSKSGITLRENGTLHCRFDPRKPEEFEFKFL